MPIVIALIILVILIWATLTSNGLSLLGYWFQYLAWILAGATVLAYVGYGLEYIRSLIDRSHRPPELNTRDMAKTIIVFLNNFLVISFVAAFATQCVAD